MSEANGVIMSRYDQLLKLMGLCDSSDIMEPRERGNLMAYNNRQALKLLSMGKAIRQISWAPTVGIVMNEEGELVYTSGYNLLVNPFLWGQAEWEILDNDLGDGK
jgi:hypothetical protein